MSTPRLVAVLTLSAVALGLAGCAKEPSTNAAPTTSQAAPAPTGASPSPTASVEGTGSVDASKGFVVEGELTVPGRDLQNPGDTCTPTDAFMDAGPGAPVKISDPSGKVIATGKLDNGKQDGKVCTFGFEIDNVQEGLASYGIEIADRGVVSYEPDELKDGIAEMSLAD